MEEAGEEQLRAIVRRIKTVAVLGAHPDESRAASYVPAYLVSQGVRCLPVNPRYEGTELFGETVRASLTEVAGEFGFIDLVDVFRPSAAIASHLDDMLAMVPLPGVVWLQLGIHHDESAGRMREAGIEVVQDRCLLVDHRRYANG